MFTNCINRWLIPLLVMIIQSLSYIIPPLPHEKIPLWHQRQESKVAMCHQVGPGGIPSTSRCSVLEGGWKHGEDAMRIASSTFFGHWVRVFSRHRWTLEGGGCFWSWLPGGTPETSVPKQSKACDEIHVSDIHMLHRWYVYQHLPPTKWFKWK